MDNIKQMLAENYTLAYYEGYLDALKYYNKKILRTIKELEEHNNKLFKNIPDSGKWTEPEINPCRGCEDYDGQGACKSNGGCGERNKG